MKCNGFQKNENKSYDKKREKNIAKNLGNNQFFYANETQQIDHNARFSKEYGLVPKPQFQSLPKSVCLHQVVNVRNIT